MATQFNGQITELNWQEAREYIAGVQPKLAEAIDELSPDDSYTLYKVTYPYGQHLYQNGQLHLPLSQTESVPITDERLPSQMRTHFQQEIMPLGVVLDKSAELFLTANERLFPFGRFDRGAVFGLWTVLAPEISCERGKLWGITAGARSAFMLPKVTDAVMHKRLKRDYGIFQDPPRQLAEHWDVFKAIAARNAKRDPWNLEIIYFSKRWLEHKEDKAWRLFRGFLLEIAWRSSAFSRSVMTHDFVFSCAQMAKNLKPNPYLADTAKNLMYIASQDAIGFQVARDDQFAPVSQFQKAYIESYGLKAYWPTVIHLGYGNSTNPLDPVYYSLQFPTLIDFSPKSRKLASKIEDLRELKHIMKVSIEEIKRDQLGLGESPVSLCRTLAGSRFNFYHSEQDPFDELTHTSAIAERDQALMAEAKAYPGRVFCENSPFLRGCIRIGIKDQEGS